jgi:Uma2 family endonuclease
MVEVKLGLKTVDMAYTVRIPDVSESQFDELVDEDTKAELIDGVLVVHTPVCPGHNQIAGFLRDLMGLYAEEKGLGEVFGPDDLVHLATRRRFAPDGFFLPQERVPSPVPEDQFEATPDLVVEVLSRSNRREDLQDKRPAYREAGVKEIWLVDPDREEVLLDRRRGRRYVTRRFSAGRIASDVVRGFWVEAAWLWAERPPKLLACLRQLMG